MRLPGQKPCCAGIKTGVLQCAGEDEGSPVAGQREDLARLYGKDSDSPVLAWRETTADPWSFSHQRQLLVASDENPLLADPGDVGRFSARPIPATTRGSRRWWLLELQGDTNDAPFVRQKNVLAGYLAYPVAIVRSLGESHPPSNKPLRNRDLTEGFFDDKKWPWWRINSKRAKPGNRKVRLAIFDDGYFPHKSYEPFVKADRQQNFSSASELTNVKESHGASCLLFASEVVRYAKAKSVDLLPYRVFDEKACATDPRLIQALGHAVDKGSDIVVAPWLIRQRQTALEDEIAALESQGILFLTGPANKRLDLDDCSCGQEMAYWHPGNNIGVVGAIGQGDDWPAAFGAKRVDVGAPGSSIYNRLIKKFRSGSSYAAPIAAAVVAVELSRDREENAIKVWKRLLRESSACKGDHSKHRHCSSRRVISFPES